jgi:hypothetical protein
VMNNARRHREAVASVDIYSSAWYFDGWRSDDWRRGFAPPDTRDGPSVARATTWLMRTGWWLRGGGLIDVAEVPAARRAT